MIIDKVSPEYIAEAECFFCGSPAQTLWVGYGGILTLCYTCATGGCALDAGAGDFSPLGALIGDAIYDRHILHGANAGEAVRSVLQTLEAGIWTAIAINTGKAGEQS